MVPGGVGTYPGQPSDRFQPPVASASGVSEYDQDPSEIMDAAQRGRSCIERFTLDLTKTGDLVSTSQMGYKKIICPGRGFVAYGFTTDDAKRAVKNTFLLMVGIDENSGIDRQGASAGALDARYPQNAFPAKHGRGYNGTFSTLHVWWEPGAHAAQSVDIIIFKSLRDPWMMDSSA